jgi:hypothetical protein
MKVEVKAKYMQIRHRYMIAALLDEGRMMFK